jgi:hypothetical protein
LFPGLHCYLVDIELNFFDYGINLNGRKILSLRENTFFHYYLNMIFLDFLMPCRRIRFFPKMPHSRRTDLSVWVDGRFHFLEAPHLAHYVADEATEPPKAELHDRSFEGQVVLPTGRLL